MFGNRYLSFLKYVFARAMGWRSRVRDEILNLLKSREGELIPQSYIHRSINASKSRVSEVLKLLEVEGLISRVRVGNQYLIKLLDVSSSQPKHRLSKLRVGIVWSSEYPFLTTFAKNLRNGLGVSLEVVTYLSAVQATKALALGEVDLALSPLITQLYFYVTFKTLKVIGGGAYGGSAVMVNPEVGDEVIYSSELSTMDLIRAIVASEERIHPERTGYFSSPEEALRLASLRKSKYMVVWHPLYRDLMKKGFKVFVKGEDLDVRYCCTLAASTTLPKEFRERLSRVYTSSLSEYVKNPERWVVWYSSSVGIPSDIVKSGLSEYRINEVVDEGGVREYVRKSKLAVPDVDLMLKALETS